MMDLPTTNTNNPIIHINNSPLDDVQYRKDVLLLPSEESELACGHKLADEAHQLGLKVPEIEAIASLTAGIASGMVDLSSSSPVLSSGSSIADRNSVCDGHQQQQQQQQHQHQYQQGQPQQPSPHQQQQSAPPPPSQNQNQSQNQSHNDISPLGQVASSLSELTVSSGPVKSGSIRSIPSLSTRPTSYCSSEGKPVQGNASDGATARPPLTNRNSMMSVLSGEKKEKRRASLKSAIGKIPFRRKRASSSGLLPPEAQITVAKGEQGEEKVYVESSKPNEPQPPATDNSAPNSSVMKLEVPVFDIESLQRSLVNPELVKMRESHRLERNRHVAFQDASMSRLRFRQQATVADRLAENKRLEDEKREKNAANETQMEERQLAVEMEQQQKFEQAKQNTRTRIKHMEGYFSTRSPPSSPGSGSGPETTTTPTATGNAGPRRYTNQQKAQLAQEYHAHESMDQLHEAKIKVLRERQERRLTEAIERMETELDDLIDKHAEGFADLQEQHQQEEATLLAALDMRKMKLRHRWNLEEAVCRRKLEMQSGKAFGPLPPLVFGGSHYETRDSAICVADGGGVDEQVQQKGNGTML